jgi:hypothetical protein
MSGPTDEEDWDWELSGDAYSWSPSPPVGPTVLTANQVFRVDDHAKRFFYNATEIPIHTDNNGQRWATITASMAGDINSDCQPIITVHWGLE